MGGGGAGERRVSGACKHCFQYLIPVYHLLCTYDWSIFAVYVKHVNRDFKIQRGDGNENVKKGLISKTITSSVHRTFLYISLPFLQYYDVKMSNFAFYGERKHATTKFYLSF